MTTNQIKPYTWKTVNTFSLNEQIVQQNEIIYQIIQIIEQCPQP